MGLPRRRDPAVLRRLLRGLADHAARRRADGARSCPTGAASFYDATYYYDFVFKLLIVIGVSFVLPVFLVALNLAGVMSGRAILKGWRVAVLVTTVFAAIATPAADVVSMLMLAGIMVVLYFAAVGAVAALRPPPGQARATILLAEAIA